MKNVSTEFKRKMENGALFYMTAHVDFANGQEKELGREDFYLSGNSYVDAAGTSSFPVGVALQKQITVSLVNDDDRFSQYDFNLAKFRIYCKLDLESTTEPILLGNFTVTSPETYGTVVVVNAVDDMYKGDKEYSTGLEYPLSVRDALIDSCSTCGVYLTDTVFRNNDYLIQKKPEGITHRNFWGLCAMLAGGNARMDEQNRLRIVTYNLNAFEAEQNLDGGIFDTDSPYSTGDAADGGRFKPWNVGYKIDGGSLRNAREFHNFYKNKNIKVATDNVVITGVQTSVDDESYIFGTDGYVLKITNQLIEDNPQEAVDRIGKLLVGMIFRPFEIDHTAYPIADFGDACYVSDRKNNIYKSFITDISFSFIEYTTIKCAADSPIRNTSSYYSEVTEGVVESRRKTENKISDYDKSVQLMNQLAANTFGFYSTIIQQEDGSSIAYRHDKPTLAESKIVYKSGIDGFFVTTNYKGTDSSTSWTSGFDNNGNAVLNILSAIGINFDWAKGGTLTLGGQNNTNGILRVLNASGVEIGRFGKDGLVAASGTFGGNLSAAGGTFKGNLSAAGGTFAGNLSAAGGSFIGDFRVSGMSHLKYPIIFKTGPNAGNYSNAIYGMGGRGYAMAANGHYMYLDYEAAMPRLSGGTYTSVNEETLELTGADALALFDADGMIKTMYTYNHTRANGPNIYVSSNGVLYHSASSAARYKKDISENLGCINPDVLYGLKVVTYKYIDGYLENDDPCNEKFTIGFIADDVEKIFPYAAVWENGQIESWNERIMIPAMLKLIQEQHEDLLEKEKKICELEERLTIVEKILGVKL